MRIGEPQGLFEVASGSVAGHDHVLVGKNNQDAGAVVESEGYLVAVVCDGCGSGSQSETGAQLGSRIVANTISQLLQGDTIKLFDDFWDIAHQKIVGHLYQILAKSSGSDFKSSVENSFLFTIVGTLIGPYTYCTFSIGDGYISVNGVTRQLGPFENNAPPYIGYSLFQNGGGWGKERLKFRTSESLPIDDLQSIIIGSDGVLDLAKALSAAGESIDQFTDNDRYFKNHDTVRRKLSLMNKGGQKIDWENKIVIKEPTKLPDDTTLIAIRRKKCQPA